MKEFSDVFSELLENCGVKQKEIAKLLGCKQPYLSKLKSGTLLPQSFWHVQNIAEVMELDDDGASLLIQAYKRSKFGDNYIRLEEAMDNIFNVEDVVKNNKTNEYGEFKTTGSDGVLETEKETKAAIFKILNGSNARLYFDPRNDKFSKILLDVSEKLTEKIKCCIVLNNNYLDENLSINVKILANILPVIIKDKVEFRYHLGNLSEKYDCNLFSYILSNDEEMLFVGQNINKSVYITKKDIVGLYNTNFDMKFEKFEKLCLYFDDPCEFFNKSKQIRDLQNDMEIYAIGYYPCVIFGTSVKDMNEYAGSIADNSNIIDMYSDFLQNLYSKCNRMHCICTTEGIKEFIHNEKYNLYNEAMSKDLPKNMRIKTLGNIVKVCKKTERVTYKALKSQSVQYLKNLEIDAFTDGHLQFYYMYGNKMRIVMFDQKVLTYPIIEYYKYLMNMDIIASKDETVDMIEQEILKEIISDQY